MIALICVAIDLFFDLYYYSGSDSMKLMINSTTFSQIVFWFLVAFNCFKVIIFAISYSSFKRAFKYEHGHTDCCNRPPPVDPSCVPPSMGG
jgi:hypothetical protein